MSKNLRECPFCGGELMFCPSHVEGDFFVNKPGGICKKCGMKFIGRGYRVYGEVKSEDFSNNKFFELWNTRPAEDALKAEIERLKEERENILLILKQIDWLYSEENEKARMWELKIGGLSPTEWMCDIVRKIREFIANNPDTEEGGEDE